MSEPKDIVCCQETGKKMAKAGYDKPTVFVWVEQAVNGKIQWDLILNHDLLPPSTIDYPAPTSSEVELPEPLIYNSTLCHLYLQRHIRTWNVNYSNTNSEFYQEAETEVEAKCAMWIYLKEKGLI